MHIPLLLCPWYSGGMGIQEIQQKIAPVLHKYGVRRASVFGSVARQEDTAESDVDLLVELGTPMGLVTYSRLARELEEVLGRKVDMITPASVNKHVSPYITRDLISVYEE